MGLLILAIGIVLPLLNSLFADSNGLVLSLSENFIYEFSCSLNV